MKLYRPNPRTPRSAPQAAFTMVEIALSLAVIGFAIVAILGVLPIGMDVQKNNRRETIINQDANYLIESLRGGARGLDDLTNYVIAITNYWARYDSSGRTITNNKSYSDVDWYEPNRSHITSIPGIPDNKYPLTNGLNIIGVLSTPKFMTNSETLKLDSQSVALAGRAFQSNYVVAYFRAISGAASEKFPQTNDIVRDIAFSYRLVSEIVPLRAGAATNYSLGFSHPSWTNFLAASVITNNSAANVRTAVINWAAAIRARTNADPDVVHYLTNQTFVPSINLAAINLTALRETTQRWLLTRQLEPNLYDLRLLFRWPLLPRNQTGNGRQAYRTMMNCSLTNDPVGGPLWYARPQTYQQAK